MRISSIYSKITWKSLVDITSNMSNLECLLPIPYETRNLGIESFAVSNEFLINPNLQILDSAIVEKEKEFGRIFVQAKLSKDAIETSLLLQQCKFYFVEVTVVPQTHLGKNSTLATFKENKNRFIPRCYSSSELKLHVIEQDDLQAKESIQVIARTSFTDDRFHIDPKCPKESADIRFVNWVKDLFDTQDAIFYALELRGRNIAFMCRKGSHLILAGFSSHYRNSGLGDYLWLSVLEKMQEDNITHAHTLISVNNVSVLNLYARLEFKFKDPAMTYHYWSE